MLIPTCVADADRDQGQSPEPTVTLGPASAAALVIHDADSSGVTQRTGSRLRRIGERGMISAEWAVGLIAAIAVAGILVWLFTKGPARGAILDIVLQIVKTITKAAG